jgi:hypothetical protein
MQDVGGGASCIASSVSATSLPSATGQGYAGLFTTHVRLYKAF